MIGTNLGPYRLDRELGVGGMGKVFEAVVVGRCPGMEAGARVALKVVHPHLLETPGFFKRFLREAHFGQSIRHPNVVRTFDCDATGDAHFLAMEYVDGQTLRDLLDELGRVPEELCLHIAREVSKGLAAIHATGVIHRDLKPDNVLITPEQVVKVMDLGVARLQDEAVRLSQTGAFVGSLQYAAPESFRGGDVDIDGRADLHALGLLLYELTCGENPYAADDLPQTLRRVLHETPRRLGDLHPQASPFFEEVVHCLLAKEPDQRFSGANELLAVLEAGEHGTWWRQRATSLRAETQRPLRRVRIPRETAVYGRENELTKLTELFEAARGGDGRVVLLHGEAGIGKSRLVDELIVRLQRDGEDLNFLFGSYPPGAGASATSAFVTAFAGQFEGQSSAAHLLATPTLAPAFDALLRGEPAPAEALPLQVGVVTTCFVNVMRSLADERPTVILIDDLHFATDEGRALFTSLALAVPDRKVLLIGTARPGVPEDWVTGLTRWTHTVPLTLGRLGPKDLARLLSDSFRSDQLATQLGHRIALKSDGNPFFAFEIIRVLREGRFLARRRDGTWMTTQTIEEIEIPSSVLDLVNARVAELTEEERELLDVACCWGFEFDPGLVGDVLGMRRIPLLKRFAQIERKHRLVRAAGRRMVFDHHQVQEALYGSLLEQLREEYHAALADALETRETARERDVNEIDGGVCVALCEQFLRGARGERALRYLPAAQKHLESNYDLAASVALTERALALPGLLDGVERARELILVARHLDLLGARGRQEEAAREAETLATQAGDQLLMAMAAQELGTLLIRRTRLEEAEVAIRRGLELARATGDEEAILRSTGSLAHFHNEQGRNAEGQALYEQLLASSRESGNRMGEMVALVGLAQNLGSTGHWEASERHFVDGMTIALELGERRNEASALSNLGLVYEALGQLSKSRQHFEQSLAMARDMGDRQGEAHTVGNLGVTLQTLGQLRPALEHLRQHLSLTRELGYAVGEAVARYNLGIVNREMGENARAVEHLNASLAICDERGDRIEGAAARLALGSLLVEQPQLGPNDPGRARCLFREALEFSDAMGMVGMATVARCELAVLPEATDAERDEALEALQRHAHRLHLSERRESHYLLWRATGDPAHLTEARRLLAAWVANEDDATRRAMLENVRLNRAILNATAERGD